MKSPAKDKTLSYKSSGDTVFVDGKTIVFFLPTTKDLENLSKEEGDESGFDEVTSDFGFYSQSVIDSLKKTSKIKTVMTNKKIITTILDNGSKISFDRTKGDNIVGTVFTDGENEPKIDFGVATDVDYWSMIKLYFIDYY
ncbi:MAG: hypothetical protein IT257_05730 [Chitinophagaceae bacterium]|nr:hypothetical protein [Chitinophagaceae bacterium]